MMRDLKECQAEVFRRSEKRIRARKQRRKRMLIACVPVVLCISLVSVFALLPTGAVNKEVAPESYYDPFPDKMDSGAIGAVGELAAGTVAVSGKGVSLRHTDAEAVQRITSLINSIVADADGGAHKNTLTSDSATGETYGEAGYQILIKKSDGTVAEYWLAGSVLMEKTSRNAYPLNTDAFIKLKDALGIGG